MFEVVLTPLREPAAGDLLVATPRLVDPNFDRTVIYVIEHQPEGTLGVVINRESEIACADAVPRWASCCASGSAVGFGGPVEPQGLLALGTATPAAGSEWLAPQGGAWRPVSGGVGLVDLTADPEDLSGANNGGDVSVRIFGGHAGWAPGQLVAELQTGAWWVFAAESDDLAADADTLWYDVLARQPHPAGLLRHYPNHPSHN